MNLKIAVRLESLGLPLREALPAAAGLGAKAVQFDAVDELAPHELSETGRRHFLHMLRSHGLAVAAVGCPTRRGFDNPDRLEVRAENVCRTLSFAYEIGSPCVVHQLGKIPADAESAEYKMFAEVVRRVGWEADRVGCRLAIETGLDTPADLSTFLAEIECHGLAVCYDPANLLHRAVNIYEGIELLGSHIVAVHVRDAARTGTTMSGLVETPVGEGDIDWTRLIGCLEEIGFRGWHIFERESGGDRIDAIRKAIAYLTRL